MLRETERQRETEIFYIAAELSPTKSSRPVLRETERQRERERGRERQTERERETDRQRETERKRKRERD